MFWHEVGPHIRRACVTDGTRQPVRFQTILHIFVSGLHRVHVLMYMACSFSFTGSVLGI